MVKRIIFKTIIDCLDNCGVRSKRKNKFFIFPSLVIIRFYQIFISPHLGINCRFYPSCSQYTLKIIQKYGIFKGLLKSLKRILRCHPLSQGGVDLP